MPTEIRPAGKPGDTGRPSALTHLKINADGGGGGGVREVTGVEMKGWKGVGLQLM